MGKGSRPGAVFGIGRIWHDPEARCSGWCMMVTILRCVVLTGQERPRKSSVESGLNGVGDRELNGGRARESGENSSQRTSVKAATSTIGCVD